MVELNGRKVDNGMNLLKLSNRFILVFEGDLNQGRLFFFNKKRFVRTKAIKLSVKAPATCLLVANKAGFL